MPLDFFHSSWEDALRDRIEYWKTFISLATLRPRATIDFETRSPCDLKLHGGWVYSQHPMTQAMCLAYKLPGQKTRLWHMAHPEHGLPERDEPTELFAFILAGGEVEAHNAFFERCIWKNVMVARHGWPEVPHLQWRCSASRASMCGLPRSLDGAAQAMGLPIQKDMDGNRTMLKLSKPRNLRKVEVERLKDRGLPDKWVKRLEKPKDILPEEVQALQDEGLDPWKLVRYHDDISDIKGNWRYCATDVDAEHLLSEAIPELPENELAIWQMDQAMNERGILVDGPFVKRCLDLAAQAKTLMNAELERITGVEGMRGTKREQVKAWLLEHEGLELPDTAGDTIEHYMLQDDEDVSPRAKRVMHLMKQVNKTSTRKFTKMLQSMAEDGRARDQLMYHGAGTARWTGKSIQVHNMPRGHTESLDMDLACDQVQEEDAEFLQVLYGDVMELLSSVARGAFVPTPGRDYMTADYSAIEARCVLWLADAVNALEVFRSGGDIYCDMATGIYGFQVTKKDKTERQFGKQAVLGLGYGMGFVTFLLTCRKYAIKFSVKDVRRILKDKYDKYCDWVRNYLCMNQDKEYEKGSLMQARRTVRRLKEAREDPRKIVHELALMKYTVDVYRTRYDQVKDMWKAQELAALQAVRERATSKEPVVCGHVEWFLSDRIERESGGFTPFGKWLNCRLPSGRLLYYADPHIKPTQTAWGSVQDSLRYYSVVKNKFVRTHTYGGKIVENITQAAARDVMAEAMLVADRDPSYTVIFSVHDELICEVDENKGSRPDFERVMSTMPAWANGCPITAEAERIKRYRK